MGPGPMGRPPDRRDRERDLDYRGGGGGGGVGYPDPGPPPHHAPPPTAFNEEMNPDGKFGFFRPELPSIEPKVVTR